MFKDLIEFHPTMQRDRFEHHDFSFKLGEQVLYPNRDHKELTHISMLQYDSILDAEVVVLGKIMAAGKFRNLQGLYLAGAVYHASIYGVRETGLCALGEALKTNTSLKRLSLVSSAVVSVFCRCLSIVFYDAW